MILLQVNILCLLVLLRNKDNKIGNKIQNIIKTQIHVEIRIRKKKPKGKKKKNSLYKKLAREGKDVIGYYKSSKSYISLHIYNKIN